MLMSFYMIVLQHFSDILTDPMKKTLTILEASDFIYIFTVFRTWNARFLEDPKLNLNVRSCKKNKKINSAKHVGLHFSKTSV